MKEYNATIRLSCGSLNVSFSSEKELTEDEIENEAIKEIENQLGYAKLAEWSD